MQIIRRWVLAAAGVAVLAACAPGAQGTKVDATADQAAVRAVNAAWFKAYAAGDAAGVAANYADDAVLSAPGVPAARGIEAIRAFYAQDVAAAQAAGISNVNDPATDVGVSGDLAWETGKFSVTAKDGSVLDAGKYSTVFARRDGGWKIIRDTWNSDAPPAAADGKVLRIVRFTAASAAAQQGAMKLVDEEINGLYAGAKGFQWVKYFMDPKTLETGSVSLWASAEDVDAFLKSDGYRPIPGKLKPLMKGAMASSVVEVHVPAGAK
jgi:uncharacterized protein (TIGR02246 family)